MSTKSCLYHYLPKSRLQYLFTLTPRDFLLQGPHEAETRHRWTLGETFCIEQLLFCTNKVTLVWPSSVKREQVNILIDLCGASMLRRSRIKYGRRLAKVWQQKRRVLFQQIKTFGSMQFFSSHCRWNGDRLQSVSVHIGQSRCQVLSCSACVQVLLHITSQHWYSSWLAGQRRVQSNSTQNSDYIFILHTLMDFCSSSCCCCYCCFAVTAIAAAAAAATTTACTAAVKLQFISCPKYCNPSMVHQINSMQ